MEDCHGTFRIRLADRRFSQMATKMAILTNEPETETIEFNLGKVHDSLSEMYNLLEEYSPEWYAEEVHNRAQSALALFRKSSASSHLNHLHQEKRVFKTKNVRRHRAPRPRIATVA
jgi:hypothetical protein